MHWGRKKLRITLKIGRRDSNLGLKLLASHREEIAALVLSEQKGIHCCGVRPNRKPRGPLTDFKEGKSKRLNSSKLIRTQGVEPPTANKVCFNRGPLNSTRGNMRFQRQKSKQHLGRGSRTPYCPLLASWTSKREGSRQPQYSLPV
jgi:hypothetical protein